MKNEVFDVIVIGSGLGGIRCTQEILKNNLKVCMITSKKFCSGASFYPKTWGLGMVAPKNKEDEYDLLKNIDRVGCNLSNNKLSKILVENVSDEIDLLFNQGIKLKRSVDDEGVVPCFDNNKRKWFGFDFKSAKEVFKSILNYENFTLLDETKVIDLYNEGDYSKGVLVEKVDKEIKLLKSKAIVIASGGFTCLFKHNFSLELDTPLIHYLGNRIGCELINLEFIQFIPAYLKPMYKTIFNERVFKYITIYDRDGNNILGKIDNIKSLLDERSTYGPFTTRLSSSIVDKTLFEYYKKNKESAYFKYDNDIENVNDTLIYNYFKWIKECNIETNNKINIIPFAHACNGGFKINKTASTNINGIYACGEATGGVHGADRIGGLSTGNALVFGKIAGENVSNYCKENEFIDFDVKIDVNYDKESKDYSIFKDAILKIREVMYDEVSILRSKESINKAKYEIENIEKETTSINLSKGDKSMLESYIKFSYLLLDSMLKQTKSIGCHCRVD